MNKPTTNKRFDALTDNQKSLLNARRFNRGLPPRVAGSGTARVMYGAVYVNGKMVSSGADWTWVK